VKISALDQSFARSYDHAPTALQETIAMAKHCEELGYERFWISEHHAFHALAGSAPEVLIAALGAATSSIRLGSGGVMLPHYSAYKVAEQFSLLANLYPGRIDLGIGRAPGSDMTTASALARSGRPSFHDFPLQVEQLSDYLWNPQARPLVSPQPPRDLPIWMLGSSADSAVLAAQRGLPYNLGAFINPTVDPSLIHHYKSRFEPSKLQKEPYAILAMSVFCAETEEQAREQATIFDVNFYRFVTGQSGGGFLSPEQALAIPIDDNLQMFIDQRDLLRAVGDPDQVRAKIVRQANSFKADEIMMVTNMYDFEARQTSFRLVKTAFED
jgi:luciferase family oxidoreductase group 1